MYDPGCAWTDVLCAWREFWAGWWLARLVHMHQSGRGCADCNQLVVWRLLLYGVLQSATSYEALPMVLGVLLCLAQGVFDAT